MLLQIAFLLILLSTSVMYHPSTFLMANTAVEKVYAKHTIKWPLVFINATKKNELTLNQFVVINNTRTITWNG